MASFQLPPEGEALLNRIVRRQETSEKRHKRYREKWDHMYSLYRSHQAFRNWYRDATDSEKDVGLRDMRREVGAELFIPRSFETVETIVPRAVSHRPRMVVLPRKDTPEENAENMAIVIDGQQEQVDYELTLEETLKSGLIFGLGVQKHFWRTELYPVPVVERGIRGDMIRGERMCGHDDPDCVDVDIFDFYWDPFGAEARTLRWAIHRTWRDDAYLAEMLAGKWNNPFGIPAGEVQASGGAEKYTSIHQNRLKDAGMLETSASGEKRHEVWEYHDGKQVVTIVDRQYPVQIGPKPYPMHGLPFTVYRPTTQGIKELPGTGVVEPIEHMQHEENAFRSLRMDNAKFAVNRPMGYTDGAIDPDDIKYGPGMWIPFRYGDPREQIFPFPIQDVPAFAYQEMDALKQDIDRVTGLSDTVYGAGSGGETATGVQMVQAAANARIVKMARRLGVEAVIKGGRMWLAMNQWKIRENRTVTVPWVPEYGGPERKWAQRVIPPEGLAGEMFVTVEDSQAEDNPAEKQQRALNLMNVFRGDPGVEQRVLYEKVLKLFGERQPASWLAPEGPKGESLMMALEQMGVSREQVGQIAEMAMQLEEQERQQQQGAPAPQQ